MAEKGEQARVFRDVHEVQERLGGCCTSPHGGDEAHSEEQQSLDALHAACIEQIAGSRVLGSMQGDSYDAALPTSEVQRPSTAGERASALRRVVQLPQLEVPPLEADVLMAQLDLLAGADTYWQLKQAQVEQFYLVRTEALLAQHRQVVSRWLRFCGTSALKASIRPDFEQQTGRIEGQITDSDNRAARMRRLPALDGKRLTSDDLMEYHRHHAHQHRAGIQVGRLIKTLDWTAHRDGCELLLRAQDQLREASTLAFQRDGQLCGSVPLINGEAEGLDRVLGELIEAFGIEVANEQSMGETAEISSYESTTGSPASPTSRPRIGLLNESREFELVAVVKALFIRMFTDQSPGLCFPPYGSAIVRSGQVAGKPAGTSQSIEPVASAIPGTPTRKSNSSLPPVKPSSPITFDTLHLKHWNRPVASRDTGAPKSTSCCASDMADEVFLKMQATLNNIADIDARLLGEAAYTDELSVTHAQQRAKEAAERHQYIALVVKGVIAPPALDAQVNVAEADNEIPAPLAPGVKRILSTPKLQAYYYLRAVQVREAKRRILMNLNFCRSVQRTLAHESQRDPKAHLDVDEAAASYDTYSCTEDGLPVVKDLDGVNVVYDEALKDMEDLQERLLRLGTHFIAEAREKFSADTLGEEADPDALFYVDTMAVLADLYVNEASYQDAKRGVVECLFEAFQNVSDPVSQSEHVALIAQQCEMRPRIDMAAPYFTEAYSAEVVVVNLHAQLLRQVASDIVSQSSFPLDTKSTHAVTLVPSGETFGVFEFNESLSWIARLSKGVHSVTTRIMHSFPTYQWTATMQAALQCAVVQEAVVTWQLLGRQQAIASASVHLRAKDDTPADTDIAAGGSHHLEDPFILDNTAALNSVINELRVEQQASKANPTLERVERESRELWKIVLQIWVLRNDLLAGVFETDVLAQAYGVQMQGFKISSRTSAEELKSARCGEASALAADYLPNLAISEFTQSFCAPDLHTSSGMKNLVSSSGVNDLRVALQLQLAQRSLLATVVDYNHSPLCQLALPAILAAAGHEQPPDESKEKKLKECFLSLYRFKKSLKDRLMDDFNRKTREMPAARVKDTKYELMQDYCKWVLRRCRGFSIVSQIAAQVQNLRWLSRYFRSAVGSDGGGVFNVVSSNSMGTDDDGAATEADGSVPPEASSGKSAAQISDMRQFFMTEGADYDLWCLPDVHAIMAVPEKDKDIAFSEEGLQMRYHTLSALAFLLRVLHLRHTLLLADAQASTDPVCVTRGVVEEMKQVRKQTQNLGSGSLPNQCVLYIINQSSCVWLTFLFSIGEWRDCLRRRRRASAETVAGQMLQLFQSNDSQNHADHSMATEQRPQHAPQPFGTEGITTRGMQAIDDVSKMVLLARQCAELDRQIFSDVKQKVASAIDTAVQGISQKQVDKHCLAVLDFVSTACAADQMKTAFIHRKGRLGDASPHTTYDKMVSAIGAGLDLTQTKMRQIKVAANEIGRDMLQSEGQELRRMYSQLTTKAIAGIPTTVQWPRVQDRFRAKLDIVSKALEAIKLKSEHEPNDEGETDLKITETTMDSIMDGLGRDLRTWAENEIAAARSAERADAADVEHLLHRQENQTLYAQHALELQKKSFARRVEAEIIDRNYQQLLDNDRLRRALRLERKKLAEHEPSIRAKVRVEYDKLVTDLVAELAKSNARFKDFQLQLTQGTLHNLNELKRSTINSMENHHATPNAFKKSAALIQAQIVEDDDIQQQNSEAQRAVLKIKSLYQMKAMKLHQEHKAKMRELEAQEQLRKESVGEGRESLEEKITLLQVCQSCVAKL
jgi:hypothetical protein